MQRNVVGKGHEKVHFFSECEIRIETTINRVGEIMSYIITRTMSLICKSSVIESQTIAITVDTISWLFRNRTVIKQPR